jgi:hypothetical protein
LRDGDAAIARRMKLSYSATGVGGEEMGLSGLGIMDLEAYAQTRVLRKVRRPAQPGLIGRCH